MQLKIQIKHTPQIIKKLLNTEDKFHEYIINCIHNKYLIEAYNQIKPQIKKYRIYIMTNKNAYDFIVREHFIIFDSINYRHKDTAITTSKRHISFLLGKSEFEIKES